MRPREIRINGCMILAFILQTWMINAEVYARRFMMAKIRKLRVLPPALLLAIGFFLPPAPLMAQFLSDEFSRDEFVESDEGFAEDRGEFGAPRLTEDFTEGGQFVDEEQARPSGVGGITIRGRTTQLRLEREKATLPLNVAWGAATGLLIGGWFALINEGNDRDTQRSIGMGAVLGGMLGLTVGLKTVIAPDAPRAAFNPPAHRGESKSLPLVASASPRPPPFQFAFRLRF